MRPGTIYAVHPSFAMEESSMRNIVQRTGKTIDEWVEILRQDGPSPEKEQREWLKAVHGFTTNYARWIVERSQGKSFGADNYDPDAHVESQYSGKKAALRPIYDALLQGGLELGPDVKACPCATTVPLFRKHVFAQIKAPNASRVDLGFCLRGVVPEGRLIGTGGEAKGDRITHRIPVTSVEEIDEELRAWYRRAYEADK